MEAKVRFTEGTIDRVAARTAQDLGAGVYESFLAGIVVGVRVIVGTRLHWLDEGFAPAVHGAVLADIFTGWLLPLGAGALAALGGEQATLLRTLRCTVITFLLAAITGWLLRAPPPLAAGALLGLTVSVLWGGLLVALDRLWARRSAGGSARPGKARSASALLSPPPGVLEHPRTLVVLLAVAAGLVASERSLANERFRLSSVERTELAGVHAVIFVTSRCPFSRAIRPAIEQFQRTHPAIHVRVLDEMEPRHLLLRDRLSAMYGVSVATEDYPVPASFTAAGYTDSALGVLNSLERLDRGEQPTIGSRLWPRARQISQGTFRLPGP